MVQNRDSYPTVRALADEVGASWELDAHIVPDDESDFGLCSVGVHDSEQVLAMMHQVADRMDDLPIGLKCPGLKVPRVPVQLVQRTPTFHPTGSSFLA